MSVQALVWALEDCPDVPSNLVSLLIGLANHADHDGKGAYPTVERLAFYTRKSGRQVQTDLAKLRELKLIRLGEQRLVAHLDRRYRPTVYDLALERRRPRYVRASAASSEQGPSLTTPPLSGIPQPGVKPDASRGEVQRHSGVKPTSPKPSLEPSLKPPPTPQAAGGCQAASPGEDTPEDQNDEVLTTILKHKPGWRKAAVRAAIKQAVEKGMSTGVAHQVMVDLAEGIKYGPTTVGPQRILAGGPWWAAGEVFVPAKPKAESCARHTGQPAHNCMCCAGERNGAALEGVLVRRATPMPKSALAILVGSGVIPGRRAA